MPRPTARRPPPLRRETWIFLPLAVALLVGVSLFVLLSYRNALELLSEEQRSEALRWADRGARSVVDGPRARIETPPDGVRALLLDRDGTVRSATGEPLTSPPFQPIGGSPPTGPVAVWNPDEPGTVVAFAPVDPVAAAPGTSRVVRVDLRASLLGGQRQALGILTVVVLAADAAAAVWLVLFLRKILSPYDALLARARAHGGSQEDESELLLRTLERALAPGGGESEEPDLEALRRTLGSSLEEGLLLLDAEGRSLMVSPRARELLMLEPPGERETVTTLLSSHPELVRLLERPLADGAPLPPTEIRIEGADTPAVRLAVSVTPLRRSEGELIGFLVLLSDVTRSSREAEERRLAEGLSHLGELSAGVAHELRNGLATVRGYLQLLEKAGPGEPEGGAYLQELDAETRHLERVVGDFLSFARPGTARPEPIDLGDLLARLARRPDVAPVDLARHGTPSRVVGDPVLLGRAFDNLLRNAREANDATASDDPVEAHVATDEGGARVTIADRGPGVPASIRDRLFHPFTSTKPEGAGLGLALAHRVVALHGGTLHLEDREGGGTKAVVWLPRGE